MKYITYKKGGNIYETYWFIWIGKLCIQINIRKRVSIFKQIKQYFERDRNLTINL
jgi:hypothetical protein